MGCAACVGVSCFMLMPRLQDDAYRARDAKAIVFVNKKHVATWVAKQLGAAGLVAACVHGDRTQPQRERALAEFRAGAARVLVATDALSRGIDVPDVTAVYQVRCGSQCSQRGGAPATG